MVPSIVENRILLLHAPMEHQAVVNVEDFC